MSVIAESVSSTVSNLDKALEIVSEMTFAEKLAFNMKFSALLAKEAKGAGAIAKAAKKEAKSKKEKDPDAPKRPQTAGQMAWKAFVKHCKETMSERFTDCTKEPERLAVCKAIRGEDTAAYDSFVEEFKAKVESGEIVAKVAEPKPKKEPKKKEEKAKGKKAKAEESDVESEKEEDKKKEEEKPKKPSAAAGGGGGGTKPSAKEKLAAVTQKRKEKEEKKGFEQIDIEGEKFWLHKETKGLYERTQSNGFGSWIGYYQPENKEEPVRLTDGPDAETA
jgi:hypothetical protein